MSDKIINTDDPFNRYRTCKAHCAYREQMPRVVSVQVVAVGDVESNAPQIAEDPERALLIKEALSHIREHNAKEAAERKAAIMEVLGHIRANGPNAQAAAARRAKINEVFTL